MEKLKAEQLNNIEKHILTNGRPIEKAKWNYLFNSASKEDIVFELLKYQNSDGGFGNGLEADILLPKSSSIASTEAIFIAYDYKLNCEEVWFKKLLSYFENSIQQTSSFWEKVPEDVNNYPHAPWWNYCADTEFTSNPCAVVASAFIKYGNENQKALGIKIAERCMEYLKSDEECSDHNCYCLQRLFEVLKELESDLIDIEAEEAMNRRILDCLCIDSAKWMEYVAQPLDLVKSPESLWNNLIQPYIDENFAFWKDTLKDKGYWEPNFSWGVDSEPAKEATEFWTCYIAVKRIKIFKAFGYTE